MTLPEHFIRMLAATESEALAALPEVLASGVPAPAAIRLNPARPAPVPEGAEAVEWCGSGFYLPARPRFTLDPALHQGRYYVQDASSMAHCEAVAAAVALALPSGRPLRYLDACAAPGGKTTAAADRLPSDAFIVANEFDPRRTSVLCENVAKWGLDNVAVTRGDAAEIRGPREFFDIIAADVPCSGEGMMRKEPEAVAQWSETLVADCACLQRRIVDNLWGMLRPGGCLIYSTCTFNTFENEQILKHIAENLGAEPMTIQALELPEIEHEVCGTARAYRFLPGRVRGEGQFIALLRKPGESDGLRVKPEKTVPPRAPYAGLLEGDYSATVDAAGAVRLIPAAHAALLKTVSAHFRVVGAGVSAGTIKGRDFIPSQNLALARTLRREAFARADVDRETALDYLARQAVVLPDGTPRGIVLLYHGGEPLGFVKNLGSRSNNLYPAPWRILNR